MAHVDCLSRAPVEQPRKQQLETVADMIPITARRVNLNLSDWISVVQREDPRCQEIMKIWNSDDKLAHRALKKEFKICKGRIHRVTPDGPRWMVPKKLSRASRQDVP